jgi:cellulose synthase/poly-beta-1,6-N-acetylglucosamine synthase-like glycosyltransferase
MLEALGPQLAQTPVEDACEVSVIMPVKDEAGRLVRALTALASQTQTDGRPFARHRYEVLVLANNCRDESAALARMVGRQHPEFRLRVLEVELQGDQACVGFARRLLMDEACRRQLSRPDPAGVIASTDGDTVVAPTWLAATLDEFNRGADAVGGRIQTDPVERAALD